jgi:hypothetical protein
MGIHYTGTNSDKYLFTIEVDPYHPNRQLSIINSNGGVPRYHFPLDRKKGVLVVMLDFNTAIDLEQEYEWVDEVHKGYYRVLNAIEA